MGRRLGMEGYGPLGAYLNHIVSVIVITLLLLTCVNTNKINKIENNQNELMACMKNNADYYAIELALIRAIAKVESNGKYNKAGIRYEPHLRKAIWYNKILTAKERKHNINYSSLGAMQILFGTAKTLGYDGVAEDLELMVYNFFYACTHLKNCLKKYPKLEDAISTYNQGKPRKKRNGKYKNQAYVDDVMKWYHEFGGTK